MERFAGFETREIARQSSRRDDQWFEFSELFKLDPSMLDKLAFAIGMRDWSRMAQTTLPSKLLDEGDPFITTLRKISPVAKKMTERQIIERIKKIR